MILDKKYIEKIWDTMYDLNIRELEIAINISDFSIRPRYIKFYMMKVKTIDQVCFHWEIDELLPTDDIEDYFGYEVI